jgi:NDP-sugar pyrophosphorylase family protein
MGTRLQPYTVVLPKPLMPIGEHPILEVIIRQLAHFRFERITLAVNHQADIIKAFFGDGSKWNTRLDYSLESMPLSTIAPLTLIPDLPENFLLMNGDVLTDLDFNRLLCEHIQHGRKFTIAAARRTHVVDYGVLEMNEQRRLVSFREKPSLDYLVSMGVYVVNRSILEMVPPGQRYGFDNLMMDLLARGESVHVEPYNGYWLDIGRVEDYMRAIDDFEIRRSQLIPGYENRQPDQRAAVLSPAPVERKTASRVL